MGSAILSFFIRFFVYASTNGVAVEPNVSIAVSCQPRMYVYQMPLPKPAVHLVSVCGMMVLM